MAVTIFCLIFCIAWASQGDFAVFAAVGVFGAPFLIAGIVWLLTQIFISMKSAAR
jgi:hypothetical protein